MVMGQEYKKTERIVKESTEKEREKMDTEGNDKITAHTSQALTTEPKEPVFELNLVRERISSAKKEMSDFKTRWTYVSLTQKDYELVNSLFQKIAAEYKSQAVSAKVFLFNWNSVTEDGSNLKEFLTYKFNATWIASAKIERSEDGKTLRLVNGENTASLELVNESTVNLKFENKTCKLIVKRENNELNVYAGIKANISKKNHGPKLRHVMKFLCEHVVYNERDVQEFAGRFVGTEI